MDDFGVNQGLVEELFLRWAENPASVDPAWRRYFDGLPVEQWPQLTSAGTIAAPPEAVPPAPSDNGDGQAAPFVETLPPTAEMVPSVIEAPRRTAFPATRDVVAATELQGRVSALVNAYRVRGHLFADLDPLGLRPQLPTEFLLEHYGLAHVDGDTVFSTGDMAGPPRLSLREIIAKLDETYTRSIGVEFTFLEDRQARRWLQESMESTCNRVDLSREEQLRILGKLTDAETFEQFLHTKFKGAKRFSVEGAESVISMLDTVIERGAELGVEELVIGMAHRGRLNVLANILEMDVRRLFAGFADQSPEKYVGGSDVKYHMGFSLDRVATCGRRVHLTLAFNPSHLEFVNPVVEGRVRAKQDRFGDRHRSRVLPLLIHGDAAFMGQGIVAETLNLSELEAYSTGGTVHVVVNNQIGFTTVPTDSRSTRYCTDITRMLRCPVFHVNGEDPEAVTQVVRLAMDYRQRFHRDVVIDLYCYRKYGHNEGDEPRFTQPVMYAAIDEKKTVREVYVDRLVEEGSLTREEADDLKARREADLERLLAESRRADYDLIPDSMHGLWSPFRGGPDTESPEVPTAVAREELLRVFDAILAVPEDFTPHRTIRRAVLDRQRRMRQGKMELDWGAAENLAMGTLLAEGVRVRLTGQDVRRGTFSHRHAIIYDSVTGRRYCRLGHLGEGQGDLEIYDSPLSEAGVLGFEWGYSLDSPDALVCWEAQFGDFANGAQVIIDQFLASSEDKWGRLSGLVLMLPHGFEGQGPEHSSGRLERFVNLCAEDNLQVCYLTTPAQLFHALRRQVLRPWRKPLVLMSPKSLLRHPRATSSLDDLVDGELHRVLPDRSLPDLSRVRRVLLCSGKVYYDLLAEREERGIDDVALVRIEQLYPLHAQHLEAALGLYPGSAEVMWVQEEPWNMGAWFFLRARLAELIGEARSLSCVARPESASPATGSHAAHELEQRKLMDRAFEPVS